MTISRSSLVVSHVDQCDLCYRVVPFPGYRWICLSCNIQVCFGCIPRITCSRVPCVAAANSQQLESESESEPHALQYISAKNYKGGMFCNRCNHPNLLEDTLEW
jgi:hypothetical protein